MPELFFRQTCFALRQELKHASLEFITRTFGGVDRYRFEQLLQSNFGGAKGVVGLLRSASRKTFFDPIDVPTRIAATSRETGELDVLEWRWKHLGELKVDGGPLDGAYPFVGFESPQRGAPSVVTGRAHLAGESLQDRHVVAMLCNRMHPFRQVVPVEIGREGFFLALRLTLLCVEGRRHQRLGQQAVTFVHEDESSGPLRRRCRVREQAGRHRQSTRPKEPCFQEFTSCVHLFSCSLTVNWHVFNSPCLPLPALS